MKIEVVLLAVLGVAAAAAVAFVPGATIFVFLAAAGIAGILTFTHSVELFVLGLLVMRASLDRLSGAGSLTPASMVGLTVVGATIVWLVLRPGERRPPSRLEMALWSYLGAAGLSIFVSLQPSASLLEFVRLASAICIFLLVERLLADGASERRMLLAILASAPIPLLVAVYDVAIGGTTESKGDFDRLSSTFAQSNGFSRYLMVFLIIGVASLSVFRTRYARIAILGASAVGSVALILTFTRASWIGVAIGLGIVLFSNKQFRTPAIATAAIVLLLAAPTVGSRFADLSGSAEGDAAINPNNSLEWRLGYWAEVIDLATESPVNGIGIGSTARVTDTEKQPHSELVRAYVELGVVGLVAYAFLMGALLHTGLVAIRRTTGQARVFSMGYLASAIAFCLVALVTNALTQSALLWYLFALSAIALSLSRRQADTLSTADLLPTKLQSPWPREQRREHAIK